MCCPVVMRSESEIRTSFLFYFKCTLRGIAVSYCCTGFHIEWPWHRVVQIYCTVKLSKPVSKRLGLALIHLVPFQVSCLELAGGGGRRTSRRVALNRAQDMGVCWWQGGHDEVWPWSPVPSASERANLVLLGFSESPGLMVSPNINVIHPFFYST